MKLVERAYLSVGQWQLDGLQLDGKAVAICFLTNAGRTPATLIASYSGCCLSEDVPAPSNYEKISNTWEGKMTVQVREEQYHAIDVPFIRTAERKAMKDKSLTLYFYGRFVYEDVFQVQHRVEFFTHYDVERGQFFVVHRPSYNYSD